jgi:ribosome-associated translation inhibitor RaiA
MTLEFNTVYGQVPEKLIADIKKEIMTIINADKKITRAEISLKEDKFIIPTENKVCKIKITAHGDDIVVHARKENFSSAIKEAVTKLKKMIKLQLIKQKRSNMAGNV